MIKYSTRLPPNKPVKLISDLVVRKFGKLYQDDFNHFKSIIENLILNPNPLVVPILDFQFLTKEKCHCHYHYDMERLGLISIEDKYFIKSYSDFMSKEERNNYLSDNYNKYPKLIDFLYQVQDIYYDLHSGNIMMDLEENYRLIDLEGFICY